MLDLSARLELAGPLAGETEIPLDGIETTIWTTGAPPLRGGVLEMSPRDLKLRVRGAVPCGSVVELELHSPVYEFHFSVRGQVHWRQPIGHYTISGVFLHQALPQEIAGRFWSDLRKELRYACDWPCLLRHRRRRTVPGQLLNYSRSGVLLTCTEPIASGEPVELLDPAQPQGPPVVNGTVRWQSQHAPNQQFLGCELPDELGVRLAAYLRSAGCW